MMKPMVTHWPTLVDGGVSLIAFADVPAIQRIEQRVHVQHPTLYVRSSGRRRVVGRITAGGSDWQCHGAAMMMPSLAQAGRMHRRCGDGVVISVGSHGKRAQDANVAKQRWLPSRWANECRCEAACRILATTLRTLSGGSRLEVAENHEIRRDQGVETRERRRAAAGCGPPLARRGPAHPVTGLQEGKGRVAALGDHPTGIDGGTHQTDPRRQGRGSGAEGPTIDVPRRTRIVLEKRNDNASRPFA